jgi:hypothetical protein
MRGILFAFVVVLGACKERRAEPQAVLAPPERVATRTEAPRTLPTPRRVPRTETRPTVPRAQAATAVAWARAETRGTAEAWDAAAEAYDQERADCVEDCLETAYAAVLARKNAVLAARLEPPPGDEPVELPPRLRAVVDALDDYVGMTDSLDPDLAGMKFLAASITTRWRQPDAVARLEALLREHPDDPTSEYAANLLLDLLVRADRIAEAKAWVDKLMADEAFLVGKDELRATLERLRGLFAAP